MQGIISDSQLDAAERAHGPRQEGGRKARTPRRFVESKLLLAPYKSYIYFFRSVLMGVPIQPTTLLKGKPVNTFPWAACIFWMAIWYTASGVTLFANR